MSSIKRGDAVVLQVTDPTWLLRTPEEVRALRDRDEAAGRYHDDGGESILYGPYGAVQDADLPAKVVVTSLRPKWVAYRKRPKGLTSGWCAALDREVGTEFSRDEGASWLVVRTEPKYVDEASSCLTMRFMASPSEDARVGSWKEVNLEDDDHVLLERHWRG